MVYAKCMFLTVALSLLVGALLLWRGMSGDRQLSSGAVDEGILIDPYHGQGRFLAAHDSHYLQMYAYEWLDGFSKENAERYIRSRLVGSNDRGGVLATMSISSIISANGSPKAVIYHFRDSSSLFVSLDKLRVIPPKH